MQQYATALHNNLPGHNKLYVCRVDDVGGDYRYRVVAAWGPVGKPKAQAEQTKGEYADLDAAVRRMNDLVREKEKGGYKNVEDIGYDGGWTKQALTMKVDMTRLVGAPKPRPKFAPPSTPPTHTSTRAHRTLEI